MASTARYTVRHAFYDVLRSHNMLTIFGNPGSTEQPMLKNFPADFRYILGLQEASVLGMAGGHSEATRRPAVVSLHSSAGTGHAMGQLMAALQNKIPLVVIAGQQTREMLLGEPLLTNRDASNLPRPHVKWSYQSDRAVDVPSALVRAIAYATQPPAGPVYLSVPMDDWDADAPNPLPPPRTSKKPVLVLGPEVDRSLAWDGAVILAETLAAPVWQAPFSERAVFPQTHELYMGPLPPARGPAAAALEPSDLVLVVGAEVFRYYPWVEGPPLPAGAELLQITNDPHDAAKALTGDSLLSDVGLALDELNRLLQGDGRSTSQAYTKRNLAHSVADTSGRPMTAFEAFDAAATVRPADTILVQEADPFGMSFIVPGLAQNQSTISPLLAAVSAGVLQQRPE